VYFIPAGLIWGSGNHSPLTAAPNYDRLALQCRVVKLLHGCVKGIHVKMDNAAGRGRHKGGWILIFMNWPSNIFSSLGVLEWWSDGFLKNIQ
jgi:hypothetical protein